MSPKYEFSGLVKVMTYDHVAGAIYITLNDHKIKKTYEIDDGILVDVDSDNKLIGIELIRRNAIIEIRNAFKVIARKFHYPEVVKIPELLKRELAPICESAPVSHAPSPV